jgi:hypothetical protein
MFLLSFRVRPGDHRPRLPHPEPELAEKTLALPHPQCYPVLRLDERGQGLAVPEVGTHPNIQWRLAKDFPNLSVLFIPESGRPSRPLQIDKSGKTLFLETADPVFNCPRGIPKQPPNFGATHPMRNEKHRMESVVVPRVPRPAYLVLEAKNHHIGVGYREFFHALTIPHPITIRN